MRLRYSREFDDEFVILFLLADTFSRHGMLWNVHVANVVLVPPATPFLRERTFGIWKDTKWRKNISGLLRWRHLLDIRLERHDGSKLSSQENANRVCQYHFDTNFCVKINVNKDRKWPAFPLLFLKVFLKIDWKKNTSYRHFFRVPLFSITWH